jgi:hypothetical protein
VRLFLSFVICPLSSTKSARRTAIVLCSVQLDDDPNSQCDTLVTIPYQDIGNKLQRLRLSFTDQTFVLIRQWFTRKLLVFPGEFKKDDAVYNMNQLIAHHRTVATHSAAREFRYMRATSCRGHVRIQKFY